MNVPAIAQKTFDELKHKSEYISIVQAVVEQLKLIGDFKQRARVVHQLIDTFNQQVFSHPLVKQMSPCQKGCHACCHTQVSITEDEAELLILKIKEDGITIDQDLLKQQMSAKNDSASYYQIDFSARKCIFLNDQGECQVYEDRPSVCRTNAVLGSKDQCDTSNGETRNTRLVNTPQSDMAIYASFLYSRSSGTLPYMIGKRLDIEEETTSELLD